MNGAGPYTAYGLNWQGFSTIIDETKRNIDNYNTKLSNSNLLNDIQSGLYGSTCPDLSSVMTNLNNLFGSASLTSSVIASPPRTVEYSLIPNKASSTLGTYTVEYDITSTNYISLYQRNIFIEYQIVSKAIPIIIQVLPFLTTGNPLGIIVKSLDQFSTYKPTIDSSKTNILKEMSQIDYVFTIIEIIFALIFAFHILLNIIVILAILFYAIKKVTCCKCLTNCCWCSFSIVIIIGFLLTTAFIGAGVLVQDFCDLISFESLAGSQFKSIIQKYLDKGPELVDICLNGDGNFGNVIGLDNLKEYLIQFSNEINNLGSLFPLNQQGLLPILDVNIGTRIDHCCISQVDPTSKECSGLFPYSTYFDPDSLLQALNNAIHSCPGKSGVNFVFYHPTSTAGLYDDCPSGSYVSSNSLSTGIQCIVLSDIDTASKITSLTITSGCTGSSLSTISDILPKLKAFAQNVNFLGGSGKCDKFYGSSTPFKGYGDSSTNNLFALFKSNIYPSSSQCDLNIIKDTQIIIKDLASLPIKISSYILGSLNCLLLKDIIIRINKTVCTNFGAIFNMIFLMIIMITVFEMLLICFITCINRRFRFDNQTTTSRISEIDPLAFNVSAVDSDSTQKNVEVKKDNCLSIK